MRGMVNERYKHYKIFAEPTDSKYDYQKAMKDAKQYAQRLRNLGFRAKVVRRHFANANVDVEYVAPSYLLPKAKRKYRKLVKV